MWDGDELPNFFEEPDAIQYEILDFQNEMNSKLYLISSMMLKCRLNFHYQTDAFYH